MRDKDRGLICLQVPQDKISVLSTREVETQCKGSIKCYRIFPLKFSLGPPGPVECFVAELSVDELLEGDGVLRLLVAVARELGQGVGVPDDEHQGQGGDHAHHAEPGTEQKLSNVNQLLLKRTFHITLNL